MKKVKTIITVHIYEQKKGRFEMNSYSQTGKANWMPVMVFQPTESVEAEKTLLTTEARIEPTVRNSCNETTTNPLKKDGTISD